MPNNLEIQKPLSSDRQVVKIDEDSTGLLIKDNRVYTEEQPTEDKEIASISIYHGAEVPFMRPPDLSRDESTDQDVLEHFFDQIEDEEIAFIRPTTPLRIPSLLDSYIEEYYHDKESVTAFRSMHELPESPYKLCKVKKGFCTGFFNDYKGVTDYINLPRQVFPKAYQPNGYIDIIKRETVDSGSTFGTEVTPFITDYVTEVDTQHQFNFLEKEITEENILLEALNNGR